LKSIRLFVGVVLVSFSLIAQSAAIEGRVINVADGDTITILDLERKQHRIRINGIDAPERGQPFGDRSRRNMADMVAGKEVTADCHKVDRYGRQVCKVWVQPSDCPMCSKTLDVGHAQILAGMAWWYREYAKEQTPEDLGRYESEENEARMRKRGLWVLKEPVAPWEWRKKPK
jgi:endonuclease YncB( thermonuclease family)